MEKQKRWQRFLIIAVTLLTIYNILPTIFFYTKPLKDPIDEPKAAVIAQSIGERVNRLEEDALSWLRSFCSLIKVSPQSITLDPNNPQQIAVVFSKTEEASRLRQLLPRAGALIPFIPKQLNIYGSSDSLPSKTVLIQRKIPLHFSLLKNLDNYFQFSEKRSKDGSPATLYRALVYDRTLQLGLSVAGASENGELLAAILAHPEDPQNQDLLLRLGQNIVSFVQVFGEHTEISSRYFASFSQSDNSNKSQLIRSWISLLEQTKDQFKLQRIALQSESQQLQSKGAFLDAFQKQRLELLTQQEKILSASEAIIKKHQHTFASGSTPLNYATLGSLLEETALSTNNGLQVVSLEKYNPFIKELVIDWQKDLIELHLYPDLVTIRNKLEKDQKYQMRDQVDQKIYNEIAYETRISGENITPIGAGFQVSLSQLQDSQSFLAFKLSSVATAKAQEIKDTIMSHWQPKHQDLIGDNFPIWDYENYLSLAPSERKLGLLIYAPSIYNKAPLPGFKFNSIYVIAKGLDKITQAIQSAPNSPQAQLFMKDLNDLRLLLQNQGLFGYSGSLNPYTKDFAQDLIFEIPDYYLNVLKATREEFSVHGTKRYGILEFSNVEQRILTENKIDNAMHEDLLRWKDDYHAAQLHLKGTSIYDVPKPTQSVFWNNLKISSVKYFRGDDRKVLHWGLDLSGGKTVQIELRDQNNRIVTNEADLKQAINELYQRVNKMGVSEVSIRQEGHLLTLDFPGSQGLSAEELIRSSSMYFYVVNEKFGTKNGSLAEISNRFLQEVWNEAVVTGKKSVEDINLIAWKHIHGDSLDPDVIQPRSEADQILYDNGLRLAHPLNQASSNNFNDAYSQIAIIRGEDFTQWFGQTHPLMIVFKNYALEGSNLKNVHAAYDPSHGNFLSFEVKSSQVTSGGQKTNPQDDLYMWTSQFSKEKIVGTPNAGYSNGKGWKMAVILNGTIISAPELNSPFRDSAMITGSFTQREVNALEADLKAGSLSFTPHILSEKNVSPELGSHERNLGILATCTALALVIISMIAYYRFGGLVASCAVIFNLLIMWATLQNIGATLTLASIAGIILTVGMAVDANVLVFERTREEFAISGRLASAIHAGYRKAFSAIFDSNITTIIAALILLNFDSGPIKGFAVTLIIGIVSSMFTALFATRYFFESWVKNPKHQTLSMAHWIKATHVNFLKYAKPAFYLSCLIIIVGAVFCVLQRHTLLGMDFTGGYSLTLEVKEQPGFNYRQSVESALTKQGIAAHEMQVRELTPSNSLRIFLSRNLQQSGKPFYGMPISLDLKEYSYPYENNPRIAWIVNALQNENISLTPRSLTEINQTWTDVSGQLSDAMRNNALIGLALALICILIYITLRFEFKYALSATLCLAHDVLLTVASIGILNALGVTIQIDLNTIAALMTIVGYSLNDTIIIFDRIREDLKLMRKLSYKEVINHALNITLSRTTMTSGTTLLVLLPLVCFGGSTIFGFALVMIIGVVFGTLSSLFIAAPLLSTIHDRQIKKEGSVSPLVV